MHLLILIKGNYNYPNPVVSKIILTNILHIGIIIQEAYHFKIIENLPNILRLSWVLERIIKKRIFLAKKKLLQDKVVVGYKS